MERKGASNQRQSSQTDARTPLLSKTRSRASNASARSETGLVAAALAGNDSIGLAAENTERLTLPAHDHIAAGSRGYGSTNEAADGNEEQQQDSSLAAKPRSPYLGDYTRTQFWVIFLGLLFGYFMAMFDSTVMASSHPVITSYFHASNAASWLSTTFMLTSTAFQPMYSRVSDTFGRKPLYLFALTIFASATTWCALAQDISSFIAARAVCGIGAGGILSMAGIITNDLVRIEYRATYQAWINIAFGLGSSCGAAFGGFLCDLLGWRWTFGIQVPPVLLIIVLVCFVLPSNLGPRLAFNSSKPWYETLRDFDFAGSFFVTVASALLMLGLTVGGNIKPWSHPLVIVSLILAFICALLLLWVESRAKRPVMPLPMLIKSPRANLVFCNFFGSMGCNAIVFNAPLYFQAVKLETPSVSGFRLVPPSILLTVFAVATSVYITYSGRLHITQILGGFTMVAGGVCLSLMWPGIPTWLVTVFLCPPSIGQALMAPATTIATLALSTRADQAVMTTTVQLWRSLGNVMGVAGGAVVLQNSLRAYLSEHVTGKNKTQIIDSVRKSVRSVHDLDPKHQAQVITAYASALRNAFLFALAVFVISTLLVLPIRLPRLGSDKVVANDDEDEDRTG